MSHFIKAKVKIKDLHILQGVFERNGLTIETGTSLTMNSRWAGELKNVKMLVSLDQGQAAVIQNEDGYELVMDNYGNKLSEVYGDNCEKLMQEYTIDVVRDQAMLMGGAVMSQTTLPNGAVEIHIGV